MNGARSSDIFLSQTLIVISTFLYKSITQITPLHKVRVIQYLNARVIVCQLDLAM